MPRPVSNALADHRRRLRKSGVVRVEVQVRKADASLVRGVVRALSDPNREHEVRSLLREVTAGGAKGFKAFLAAAPLEGVDLSRAVDTGRDVEL